MQTRCLKTKKKSEHVRHLCETLLLALYCAIAAQTRLCGYNKASCSLLSPHSFRAVLRSQHLRLTKSKLHIVKPILTCTPRYTPLSVYYSKPIHLTVKSSSPSTATSRFPLSAVTPLERQPHQQSQSRRCRHHAGDTALHDRPSRCPPGHTVVYMVARCH